MAASTGLVLGHNEYTTLSQFERTDGDRVTVTSNVHLDSLIMDGYTLVAYTQAAKQSAYIQAISDRNTVQAAYLGEVAWQAVQSPLPVSTSKQDRVGREESVASFIAGWRAAGGVEGWIDFVVNTVIECESSWNINAYNPAGPYYGLGQWLQSTWDGIAALTGKWDLYNPEHQGANMAYKSRRDGGFAWPECWEARWN